MGYLFSGVAAVVDLSAGKVENERLDGDFLRSHVGGAAVNLALYEKYRDGDPIIIGTGPLTGTLAPGAALGLITARSPLDGMVRHAPFCLYGGGEFKFAGFDFVVIRGRAETPAYLWLHDEIAEIHGAGQWWECDSWRTTDDIRRKLGEDLIQVLVTGPAAARGSPLAQVLINYWATGDRWGIGSVLGGKNLKALAVRGMGMVEADLAEEFVERCAGLAETLRQRKFQPGKGSLGRIEGLAGWVKPLIHRYSSCLSCPHPCHAFVKYREDPGVLISSQVGEPGLLITDAAALQAFRAAGFAPEEACRAMEECLRYGAEAGAVAALAGRRGISRADEVARSLPELARQAAPASAGAPQRPGPGGGPHRPMLLPGWGEAAGSENIALAYLLGICPTLSCLAPELSKEVLLELVNLGTGWDLTAAELDRAVKMAAGWES